MATLKPPSSKPGAPQPLAEQPLHLTIRFAASIPDLELDILHPASTTVVSLKHTIRGRLDSPDSERRLRFIHAGKILPDTAALSSVLKAPLPPPPSARETGGGFGDFASRLGGGRDKSHTHDNNESDHESANGTGKGKSIPGRAVAQRIYVNCSIGASLTTAELEAEAEAAAAPPPATYPSSLLPSQNPSAIPSRAGTPLSQTGGTPVPSTTTAPRGFDRLLSAGFTSAEVNQLRLQFRSLHSNRFTPDTMPSPDSFRRMEDAWIDDNHAGAGSGGVEGGGAATTAPSGGWGEDGTGMAASGTDSDDAGLAGLCDVMIRGIATGFLWPLGSAAWLVREEGMASGRWRLMVGVGVAFSFLIGIIRTISGPMD